MNSTNTADNTLGIEKLSKASFIMTLCLNAPMASFGIFGNIFTLVMLMRKVIPGTDSLRLKLIHLTIVDLVLVMQMTVVIGFQINSYLNPVGGIQLLNIVFVYITRSTLYIPYSVSAYLLMFIAVERVIAIVKPFKVKTFCSYELVRAKLCVCYFIAVVFGILKATEFKLVYNQENSRHTLRFTETGKNRSLMSFLEIFVVVVYFVIPIVITLICNIIFVASLLHHRHKMARMVADVNSTVNNNKKSKAEGMIILLTVLFFTTIAPSAVMRTYIMVTDIEISKHVRTVMGIMSFMVNINHCLNPIVYTVTVAGYRQRLIQFVTFNTKGRSQSSTS